MTGFMFIGGPQDGRSACSYVDDGAALCEHAAVVHVWVTLAPAAAAAFCLNHWLLTRQDLRFIDIHTFGDHCNLPGATWFPSNRLRRGTCRLPDDLTEDVERFANQPVGASA